MKGLSFKKACALVLAIVMIVAMVPMGVFAEESETVGYAASAEELETALASDADKIVITADFEIDRTYYIVRDVIICAEEAHTLTRKLDFAGDFFVIGENAEGVACEERVTLTVGTKDTENEDMLIFEGNKDGMEVSVVGTVFFVCAQGQADLCPDVTVQNFKKTGNDRALSENHGLSNNPANVGGAVGIIANGGVMNIYGGKYVNNGVEDSGLYGGAFFNHSTLNVYDGLFDGNYALRAGAFYNYRTMYLYKGTIQNNKGISTDSTSSLGGAIYLPSSSGAKLYIGGNEKTDEIQVVFKNNTAHTAGAISTSGDLVVRNTLFEANTSLSSAAAVYASGTFASVKGYDCIFKSNTATDNGGAVYVKSPVSVYFRDTVFEGNSAVNGGVAFAEGGSLELNYVTLKQNTATGSGGAVYMSDAASVVMNEVIADSNSAATHGGVLYSGEGDLKAYNSTFKNNTALTGSAMRFYTSASADFYNCVFEKNTCADATTGNAGALFVYTGGTKVSLNTCTFTENASKGLGGAILVSGKSLLDLYNITAEGNSALKGGFMYETTATTVVTANGLTVSNNTASVGGDIIWGNTLNAKLFINKDHYVDKDATDALDDAYWKDAIYNKLTVTEIEGEIPRHADYGNEEPGGMWDATDVKSAEELESAINSGKTEIRVIASFDLDRTYYITNNVTIFATAPVTLKRAADFAGDIFVVGENAEKEPCAAEVSLTIGIPTSQTENLFVIDGNASKMTVDVNGTVFFVCANGNVNLYENLTVKNCKKVSNERTLEEVHGVSYPDLVGGAVGILAKDSSMNIYGGTYTNNRTNESGKSSYGGAFYNFGVMNVYGGTYTKSSAARAGVFYNYRTLNLYKAEISQNAAKTSGGAIYMPASTGSFLYVGKEAEGVESGVIFANNTCENNGGAIYANNVIEIDNASFEGNEANNGGAIAVYSARRAVFTNISADANSAAKNGEFVYVSNTDLQMTDCEIENGGVVCEATSNNGHIIYFVTETEPTCTENGFTTYSCQCCEHNRVVEGDEALGHSFDEGVVTAPTCTEVGYTTYTCTVCGETEVRDEVEALGHDYEAVVTEPTCTEAGYTTYTCPACGDSYVGDEVEALGHNYEAVVTEPTCTEAGYTTYTCPACGETEVRDEVEALGHSYEAVVTEPTCTEAGYTTYTCPACGDSYVGDEVEALGHSYASTVVPPTETEQGYTDHTCSVCGDNYKDNYTDPVTPEEPEVPTNKVSGVTVTEGDISITVSWDAFAGADRYVVKALKPDGTALTTKTVTEGTSVEITGFEYDTVYTFFVVARVGGKYQTQEDADLVTGQLKLGDRVVGIKSSVKGRTITVEWMAYPGATNYYVFVYPKGADPTVSANRVTAVTAGTATSVGIINAISPETDYEIYVSARVNGKYQTLENALYTSAVIPVTAPSSFEITSIEPTIVRIKWPAVKNADRYWARLIAEDGETVVMTKQSLKALISFTKLTPGATYYVQLQARVPKSSGGNQYSGYCDPIMTQPIVMPTVAE